MKLELTPDAEEDLDSIRRWIARDDRSRAIGFTRELVSRIARLTTGFARYPEVDPVRFPGLHRLNYRGYRIYYRVNDDTVEVLRVHHGRRATPDFRA